MTRVGIGRVNKGRQKKALTLTLIGVEGVGKTTFGGDSEKPIFLDIEDGSWFLDVQRFDPPEDGPWTWEDVLDCIDSLRTDKHDRKTLVVDTVDSIEPLVWRYVCKRDKKDSIESYGYGKGYVAANDEWRVFIAKLERLKCERGMTIILLAHSQISPFKNPEGPDYERFELKLHKKAAGLIKERSDVVLFCNYETFVDKEKGEQRHKGYGGEARVMYSERRAAYDAKNRLGLPPRMEMGWDAFWEAVSSKDKRAERAEALRKKIAQEVKEISDDKVAEWVKANVTDKTALESLMKIDNRLVNLLSEKRAELFAAEAETTTTNEETTNAQ
jgi:uncharacterized protein (UPF0335 family)